GRHHPGMVGEIISEWWATSNRNGGRHHSGMVGDIERNQHSGGRSSFWPGSGHGGAFLPTWRAIISICFLVGMRQEAGGSVMLN
ncbi:MULTISPECIES: hypothetical protein, partial [Bradyrhizobium]|uniref:hypothetical protein n=1 Tax=Bradyrhizobium TaxID=374 RepID=UPI001EDBF6F4